MPTGRTEPICVSTPTLAIEPISSSVRQANVMVLDQSMSLTHATDDEEQYFNGFRFIRFSLELQLQWSKDIENQEIYQICLLCCDFNYYFQTNVSFNYNFSFKIRLSSFPSILLYLGACILSEIRFMEGSNIFL